MKMLMISILWMLSSFHIIDADDLVGKWKYSEGDRQMTIHFKADDTYEVDFGADGTTELKGTYVVENDQVIIEDLNGDCAGKKGIYTFKVDQEKLVVKTVSDACPQRGNDPGQELTLSKI